MIRNVFKVGYNLFQMTRVPKQSSIQTKKFFYFSNVNEDIQDLI